jgi:hypothetical protein
MRYEIKHMRGLSRPEFKKLGKLGIRFIDEIGHFGNSLYVEGGIPENRIVEWIQQNDLMKLQNVGPSFAYLIHKQGVHTRAVMSDCNPEELWNKIVNFNRKQRVSKRPITLEMVQAWKKESKEYLDKFLEDSSIPPEIETN